MTEMQSDDIFPAGWRRGLLRGIVLLLAVFSIAFILLFFFVAFRRVSFPLQLEWLEGSILDNAARVLHHEPLYVQPTYRFVSWLYTPLFYYVGAVALKLGGPTLQSLRLLSIASTAGCLLLLFVQARSMMRSRLAGLLAVGLFAALYGAVDGWYDLARIDMLCLLLTLLAIVFSYRGLSVLAAVTFVLAYQTKQSAGVIAIFVLLHEFSRPRKMLTSLAVFFAGTVASIVYLNHASGGWYDYYTLQLPGHQPLLPEALVFFWTKDLFSHLGLAIAVIAFGVFFANMGFTKDRKLLHFVLCVTAGTGLSAFSGRLHSGGSVNALLPLYAWICVLFGVAVAEIRRMDSGLNRQAWMMQLILLCMCVMQFAQLVYPANKMIPSRQASVEARAVMSRIGAMPGDYFVFDNCVDLTPVGKEAFANSGAAWDILRGDRGEVARGLKQSLDDAMAQHIFTGVVATGALAGFPYSGAPPRAANAYDGANVPLSAAGSAADLQTVIPPAVSPGFVHYARP